MARIFTLEELIEQLRTVRTRFRAVSTDLLAARQLRDELIRHKTAAVTVSSEIASLLTDIGDHITVLTTDLGNLNFTHAATIRPGQSGVDFFRLETSTGDLSLGTLRSKIRALNNSGVAVSAGLNTLFAVSDVLEITKSSNERLNGRYVVNAVTSSIITLETALGLRFPHNIVDATNSDPIQITTNQAHGFVNGDEIWIKGVGGNTAANSQSAPWIISDAAGNIFTLVGGIGNGAYTLGGLAGKDYPDVEEDRTVTITLKER